MKNRKKSLAEFFADRWALFFLVAEIVFFAIVSRGFLTPRGIQIIFFFGTSVFLLSVGETFVIITGGIDLSVGFVMGFASIVAAKLIVVFTESGMAPAAAILVGMVLTFIISLLPGLINGSLVAFLKVPPFIATFSMIGISHGVSELLIEGVPAKNLPHLANVIGNGHLFYYARGKGMSIFSRPELERGEHVLELLPNIVIITFILIAVFSFILKRTRYGQHTYAIGGNVDAALRSGINVKRHLVTVYMVSSFFAGAAGVIYMLQYVTGKADAGAALLLDGIAAVVIGGASLYGGKGTIWRTILGALIIATLETGLRIRGVPTFDKYILVGVILIGAVLVDQIIPERVEEE
ncbi:MAG: ABC transporter permease [Spirochaetales bacterium]|nr:ABC transporter permease [Spirochaetales bacterium]MCF7938018.1 ABC transporter permease [Spirochaetales bacterium]